VTDNDDNNNDNDDDDDDDDDDNHFINHNSSQTNMNSTIQSASKVAEGLNQSNENIDTKKGRHLTHKSKIRRVLNENTGKQSNTCPVY
jgi:hypothetical protein